MGFARTGPQPQAALNRAQQSERVPSLGRELTGSLSLGWTCQPTSQLLHFLEQPQQGSDSPPGQGQGLAWLASTLPGAEEGAGVGHRGWA